MKSFFREISIIALVLVASFLVVSTVSAQTNSPIEEEDLESDLPTEVAGNASCFDYYQFQSVDVSVGADKDNYTPGQTINFSGVLRNKNNYPVVDGYVFARVSKENPNYSREGHFIVDEIIPLQHIVLDAKASLPVVFSWTVPSSLANGKYRADYFFSVGKKFNLGGLPFSNEVTAGSANFNISSGKTTEIVFDRSASKINSVAYPQIGSWPIVEIGKPAIVEQTLVNDSAETKTVTLDYGLYFWDSLDVKDRLLNKTETLKIAPKSSQKITYTIPNAKETVYYLSLVAKSGSEKSIINTRIATEGERPRLNYPAINAFPVMKGSTTTLFSCFHNTSNQDTSGSMDVSLFDKSGSVIDTLVYTGLVPSAMSAEKKDINPTKSYDYVRLVATMKDKSGTVVDSYETIYDCAALQSDQCKTLAQINKSNTLLKNILFVIIGLVIIIAASLFLKKRKTVIASLFILIVAATCFSFIDKVEAYSQQSATVSKTYVHAWKRTPNHSNRQISQGYVSVQHKVDMTEGSSTVNVGQAIRFSYNPEDPSSLSTGGNWDTPYGAWCNPVDVCSGWTGWGSTARDQFKALAQVVHSRVGNNPAYIFWSVLKPTVGVSGVNMTSSNPSVVSCTSGTMNCVAVGAGTATLTAHIPGTTAKIWSLVYRSGNYTWQSDEGSSYLRSPASGWNGDGVNDGQAVAPNTSTTTLSGATMGWNITVNSVTVIPPLSASCSVTSDNGFVATSTVTWTVNPSGGTGSYTYSWIGDLGLSGNSHSVSKSYSAPGIYHATSTITSGTSTISVGCPGSVTSDGGGCSSCGDGVEVFNPATRIDGACSPLLNQCSTGTFEDQDDNSTDYLWLCNGNGIGGATNDSCSLSIAVGTSTDLGCKVSLVSGANTNSNNKTLINTNTHWVLDPAPSSPDYDGWIRHWTVALNDSDPVEITPSNTSDILDKFFNTVGLRKVDIYLSSSTDQRDCGDNSFATTSIVTPDQFNED